MVFIFLLLTTCTFSQNTIFIGSKSYDATNSWTYEGSYQRYAAVQQVNASIQVGKKGKSGLFSISVNADNSSSGIKGSIRIYLDNSKTILLSKVLAKDYVDNESVVIYEISETDCQKLKESNIKAVRFNLGYTGQVKGYTVNNIYNADPDPRHYQEKHSNTAIEITNLFNN